MKKRKNKSNVPRHKRMKKESRLQAAKHWIGAYEGKNIVHGYSNHWIDLVDLIMDKNR